MNDDLRHSGELLIQMQTQRFPCRPPLISLQLLLSVLEPCEARLDLSLAILDVGWVLDRYEIVLWHVSPHCHGIYLFSAFFFFFAKYDDEELVSY
jgi:hypothetical protein